jgi:hypothetical protein
MLLLFLGLLAIPSAASPFLIVVVLAVFFAVVLALLGTYSNKIDRWMSFEQE